MTRLGLRSPGEHQIAAIRLPHTAVHPDDHRAGVWQRFGAYFNRSEAQAAPAPR
ncbi:MAG TPA: hypothetical protein VGX75_16975 [bacterium]|nr:hypothetical protein [bacterium]